MNDKYDGTLTIQTDPSLSEEDKAFYKRLLEKANFIFNYLKTRSSLVDKYLHNKSDFYQFGLFSPFYKIDFDLKERENFRKNNKDSVFFNKLYEILDLFHITNGISKNFGLYKNNENVFVREPSITISYGLISREFNFLISCLITDLAFQQQESSIAFSTADKKSWDLLPDMFKGIGYNINLKNISYEKIVASCFESEFECTIGFTKRVFAFYKINSLDSQEFKEHESLILNYCQKMENLHCLEGSVEENSSYQLLNFKFLTKEIRDELYNLIIKTYITE